MTSNPLVWTEEFAIGVSCLDYEHRNLFATINRLHEALDQHDDPAAIEDCLGEIHARMAAHFALEEKIMQERKYPHYAEHKTEHDALLDVIVEAMLRYQNDPSPAHTARLRHLLTGWIVDHVLTSDKKMSLMAD